MDELRENAIKVEYLSVFQSDINAGRLTNIQKLYEAAHITNDMLVEQLHKHTGVMTDLSKAVFNDIAFILVEELVNNKELEELFDSLYYNQYKDIFDAIESASDLMPKNRDRAMSILSELARKVLNYSGTGEIDEFQSMSITRSPRYRMMCLLNMRSDALIKSDYMDYSSVIAEEVSNWNDRKAGKSELYHNDSAVLFTDEGEPVFRSKMYQKFIERQKKAISAYLGVSADKLADYFYEQLAFDLRQEDFSYLTSEGDAGIANLAALHVVQSNYGGAQWFQTITSPKTIRKGSKGYRPDFDKLVDLYYRARIMNKYFPTLNAGREFTKAVLSRECKSENPRDDYLALLYLYNMDIVYQMFNLERELYYQNFSWENISRQTALSRSNQIIQDMRNIISAKNRTIADLSRRLALEKEAGRKDLDEARIIEIKQENRLLDDIQEKEKEIEELKEKLRIQNELIDEFSREESEPEDVPVDMEVLRARRYLFVGHTDTVHPELDRNLRGLFPDSVFMEENTNNIDQIQVDAVVVFLNWTSHGMYYKVKSNTIINKLPTAYCRSANIDKICQEMQSAFER